MYDTLRGQSVLFSERAGAVSTVRRLAWRGIDSRDWRAGNCRWDPGGRRDLEGRLKALAPNLYQVCDHDFVFPVTRTSVAP